MESPIGESLPALSPDDTISSLSEDRSDETAKGTHLEKRDSRFKRRQLPSLITSLPLPITSFPTKRVDDPRERLRSATVAVARVLGVDTNELPQPFYGLIQDVNDVSDSVYSHSGSPRQPLNRARSTREDSDSSASAYSPYIDTFARRTSSDNSIARRLIVIVTDVLGLDSSSLPLEESFVDLGGTYRKAREVRARCIDEGFSIKTKDMMNCRTIAELQTRVMPLTQPLSAEGGIPPMVIDPLECDSSDTLPALQRRRAPSIPQKAPARSLSSRAELKQGQSRKRNIQVEHTLALHEGVSRAVVLKPKAGPFEDQLVAFITLSGCEGEGPDDCEVRLQSIHHAGRLSEIRRSVESKVPPGLVPTVWIVLEKMPVDDAGKTKRRKLQTWIQNANEELQRQILSIESGETARQLPPSGIERWLQKTVSSAPHTDEVGTRMDKQSRAIGGDLDALRLVSEGDFQGVSLGIEHILQAKSLSQLTALAIPNGPYLRDASAAATEAFELSPMQRLYFHTHISRNNGESRASGGERQFNQSMLFRLTRRASLEDVRAAVEALVNHHAMLRCRFHPVEKSWCQSIEPEASSSYHFAHHSVKTDADVEEVVGIAQAAIDINTGPIFAAHHFDTHDGYQMLYLVAHHLVVDLKSWSIIVDDLEALLTQGCPKSGPSTSFQEWIHHRRRRIETMAPTADISFGIPVGNPGYWGVDEASNTYGNTTSIDFTLGVEETLLLETSSRTFNTSPADILIATLILSFAQTFRDRQVPAVWSQEHERSSPDIYCDVSETVGWFTYLCLFALEVSPTDDILTVFDRVKDLRHTISADGALHFTRNLVNAESAFTFASTHLPLELMFTYSGTMQQTQRQEAILEQITLPGQALASSTSDIGRDVGRVALFEVSTLVDQGESKVKILYHKDSRYQEQIGNWIHNYELLLRRGITRLQHKFPGLSLPKSPHLNVIDKELSQLNRDTLSSLSLSVSDIEAIYPATPIQQNILVNDSIIPGSSKAEIIYDLDTSGSPVDISRVCAAWNRVTEHHSALRTVFYRGVSKDGLYDQIVLRSHSPNMLFLESDSVVEAMASLEKLPPLALDEGIPWHRLVVCQVANKTFLKLEMSQAACDVPSMSILFRELEQAYFHNLGPSTSEVCCSEYLQCLKEASRSVDFWKEHLRNSQPCRFPTIVLNPTPSEWDTTSTDLEIPCEHVETFAKDHGVEISTVLRVAWALVLRTYIGTDDVCFGCRVSGRDLPVEDLSDAVGSFSTVLPYKLTVPRDEPLVQLLLDAEDEHRRTLRHQYVPVARIEHELDIKGGHLFNTCLSFGYEGVSNNLSNTSKCQHVRTEQASEYDINTDVHFHGGNVTVDIGYRILISDQATGIANAFRKAVETILSAPTRLVGEVDLFSAHDNEQILAWDRTPEIDVPQAPVHQLVANRASLNPEMQAVCAWDGDLSYGELHELSVILAKYLLAFGLKPQAPVPVIVEKSRWAVVAMLAVLHAGAILVPVDAELISTFARVIQTVGADLVLVSDQVRQHVSGFSVDVIVVNGESILEMATRAVDVTPPQPAPYEIACILLGPPGSPTSSRATPYGHATLAAACLGQGPALRINPSSRVMQISSYSTDIALAEVFTTLVQGGCVCVPSAAEKVAGFTEAARRMRVNWTYFTPALSRKIDPESLEDLAVVCFPIRHLDGDAHAPWIGKTKVLLVYGVAEACPLGLSATEATDPRVPPCFGRPFSGNFRVVSPEDNSRLVPVGAVGELVIGGPMLASGFDISDPDAQAWAGKCSTRIRTLLEKSGSRLLKTGHYKTGHYVRYREGGQIEFIWVAGEEMEIDGKTFRPKDIELRLRRCLGGGVDVAVETIAFNDPGLPSILAAFVELDESAFQGSEGLSKLSSITRERLGLYKKTADMTLREALPSYMVPTTYIPVKAMPLTPDFQINREELQRMITGLRRRRLVGLTEANSPVEERSPISKPLPSPRVEEQMRAIWAEVLYIKEDAIAADAGFLSLGGDTVLAHDLVSQCRQKGINISTTDVLRDVSFANLCKGAVSLEAASPVKPQETKATQPDSPDSFASDSVVSQLGFDEGLIEDVAEASSLQTSFVESGMLRCHGNISYITININGPLKWHNLENACFLLVQAHPTLRTAFISRRRKLYQTVLRSYHPEVSREQCQSWRLSSLASKSIKKDQQAPVDFRRPVTKFFYFDAGKSSILIMRLSRAQYDDLSLPVLMRDLGKLYQQNTLTNRYPSFCEVVKTTQQPTYSNSASEYWRGLLEGASMTQVVSQPSPASINSNSTTIQLQVSIPASSQNMGISFETILKGAWSIVLSNLSGSDDVVFGQLVDGRRHRSLAGGHAIADVVGPMGNIVPVRTRLPDAPVLPYKFLRRVQNQRAAGMPYETMQTADVVRLCTAWPAWARFSTVVCHRDRGAGAGDVDDFAIGDASCSLGCVESAHHAADLFVESVAPAERSGGGGGGSGDVADVSLSFCAARVDAAFADAALAMLGAVIAQLAAALVTAPLRLRGLGDSRAAPRIPLAAPGGAQKRRGSRGSGTPSPVDPLDPDRARAAHTLVSAAWDAVLDARALGVPDLRAVPFWEIWGALVPAAELARYYSENMAAAAAAAASPGVGGSGEPHAFAAEDILTHPTMMQQYELVVARQQEAERRAAAALPRPGLALLHRPSHAPAGWPGRGIRRAAAVAGGPPALAPPRAPAHHVRSSSYPEEQRPFGGGGAVPPAAAAAAAALHPPQHDDHRRPHRQHGPPHRYTASASLSPDPAAAAAAGSSQSDGDADAGRLLPPGPEGAKARAPRTRASIFGARMLGLSS
ncbi:hypothetical protein GGS23DRAFT_619944 [Durotheca rogersii]|uniref:uncharacterized protein n=1 Tax=Durotheca rogersii TaxID=419775 RepID=UPI00221F88A2|nr:uncharacterized protein GGS23DRAFT_619944 [Durotheca rogersii]KAI5864131.1 hypothetical protein GGS23DRAFT_619944 [Durotheca rogersii]